MPTLRSAIPELLRRNSFWMLAISFCCLVTPAAFGATYYVGPSGSDSLSTSASSPGSLSFAVANAPSGSTVILENGAYDSASQNGFAVTTSNVTFQAQSWHGAIVKNSVGSGLWGPSGPSVINDTCQGIVFGPCTGLGWSGGGGPNWQFLDCEFVETGGVGAGDHALFERCLFTDCSSNSFDFGGTGITLKDCIARRGNRASADDDGVGNKEDYSTDFTVDDLIAYDNNGTAMWFDTSNDGWVVKNSTFFGNHGGNNWYYGDITGGTSTTQFDVNGQDGQGISVGQPIMFLAGTPANINHTSVITAVSGYGPQKITVSPALPAIPAAGDRMIIQQDSPSSGDGFTTEANDDGVFTNNVAYCNTDRGIYDHASGGTRYGGSGGIVVTDNLFAYNGEGFDYWPDGRDDGPALVQHNRFKFRPGSTKAFGSGGGALGSYGSALQVAFDYNVYDPDTEHGKWAQWYAGNPAAVAGGLTYGSQPAGQDYLQNPATWNQDQHSIQGKVAFWGTPPTISIWPAGSDKKWSDVFYPNNKFGLANSIHQIDDTDGAVDNTIDAAVAGHAAGDIVFIPVSAHTSIVGNACEVYDLNGRWVKLTVRPADQGAFLATVPPYVTCVPGNRTTTYKIRVTLTSNEPYDIEANYSQTNGSAPAVPTLQTASAGGGQAALIWQPAAGADSYDVFRATTPQAEGNSLPIATGITATSYVDNGLTDGTMYYYEVRAVNTYGDSSLSNELNAKPHNISGGSLAGSEVSAKKSSYDLTSLGTIDWRQWGDMGGTNHKATGGGQISDLTLVGGGKDGRWSPGETDLRWADSASGIGNNHENSFLWANNAQNTGWTFTVPADTTKRTLNIIWGGADGTGVSLTAHLSDGSAPDYTNAYAIPGVDGSDFRLETIIYNAAKPGQTLTITLLKTDPTPGPSLDIVAAWLH